MSVRHNCRMITSTRAQRIYDHRLKQLVRQTGKVDVAVQSGVPRSTAYGWLTKCRSDVVTLDVFETDVADLQREVIQLRRRCVRLVSLLRLIITVMKVSGFSMARVRLSDEQAKQRVLRAIEQARVHFTLRATLRVTGLTHGRFHAWTKGECGLDDSDSCPKTSPHQLTPAEVSPIREMVTSDEFRHVPTGTLARLAERMGRVFASASTWYRLVRQYRWRRPRHRVHPAKPKVGVRAALPNEIWHIDTTLIRLLDGSRVYLHAVIDNFSRRILAWRVLDTFHPAITAQLLLDAYNATASAKPTVVVDGGIENYNAAVDELVKSDVLKRVLAQTEIRSSNSMIESWWRVLKHQWLYLNQLDSVQTVRSLVAFYVEQHNTHLPHSAFEGQTPEEMYFATGDHVPKELQAGRLEARRSRLQVNRVTRCGKCESLGSIGR
jgi:putative transposase